MSYCRQTKETFLQRFERQTVGVRLPSLFIPQSTNSNSKDFCSGVLSSTNTMEEICIYVASAISKVGLVAQEQSLLIPMIQPVVSEMEQQPPWTMI